MLFTVYCNFVDLIDRGLADTVSFTECISKSWAGILGKKTFLVNPLRKFLPQPIKCFFLI